MQDFLYVSNGGSNNVSAFNVAANGALTSSVPGSPFSNGFPGGFGLLSIAVFPPRSCCSAPVITDVSATLSTDGGWRVTPGRTSAKQNLPSLNRDPIEPLACPGCVTRERIPGSSFYRICAVASRRASGALARLFHLRRQTSLFQVSQIVDKSAQIGHFGMFIYNKSQQCCC